MEKKRLDYLDMVKGVGIILVVAGHSGYLAERALTVVSSFHMPLFFIVSGMLLAYTKEETRPMKQVVIKKLRTILLPYAVFSVLYLLIYGLYFCMVRGYLTPEYIRVIAVQGLFLDGISVLWFLSALFLAELLWHAVRKCCGRAALFVLSVMAVLAVCFAPQLLSVMTGSGLLVGGVFGLLQSLLRGIVGAGFLTIGYLAMGLFERFHKNRSVKCRIIEGCMGVLCLLLTAWLSLQNGRTDMHYLIFHNPVIYLLCACMGTFGLVIVCRALPYIKALAYLGANSLTIMVTHLDCQYMLAAIGVGHFFVGLSPYGKWYCFYFGITLGMTLLELLTIYLVNRFCPFLVGKAPLSGRRSPSKSR